MSMETLIAVVVSVITTAAVTFLGTVAFMWNVPPKKQKWKECPTCHKWSKAN